MQYVTNPEKAAFVSVRNLFEGEDYAELFTHDRKDNVSSKEAHRYAKELTARPFPECECLITAHRHTDRSQPYSR